MGHIGRFCFTVFFLTLISGILFFNQVYGGIPLPSYQLIHDETMNLADSFFTTLGVRAKGANVDDSTPDTRAPSTVMNDGIPVGVVVPENFDGFVFYDQEKTATSSKFVLVSQVINITPINGQPGDAPNGNECEEQCDIIFVIHESNVIDAGLPVEELCNLVILHDVNDDGDFDDANEVLDTKVTDGGGFPGGSNEKPGTTGTSSGLVSCSLDPKTPGQGGGGGQGGGVPKPGFRVRSDDVPNFSKFAVGGKVTLSPTGSGSSSSNGGRAPTIENISVEGVSSVNDEGTLEFGGFLIDKIQPENNFPTQTIKTGVPFKIRLPFYEDNGIGAIQHVALYFLQDSGKTIYDSDTFVIFEPNTPLKISDPNGLTSNVNVVTIEKSAHNIDIIFEITFEKPMETSDVILRSWDNRKRSTDIRFNDLIEVIENNSKIGIPINTGSEESPWMQTFQDSKTTSTTIINPKLDNLHKSVEDNKESHIQKIPMWIKNNADWWAHDEIDNEDFVAGIQYLIDENMMIVPDETGLTTTYNSIDIPNWIRKNASWWAEDSISDSEFIQGIQWLVKKGIIRI